MNGCDDLVSYKDSFSLFDENGVYELAAQSVIGDREEQQDRFGYDIKGDEGITVVCDGMGGHQGGRLASTKSVEMLLDMYNQNYPCLDLHKLLTDSAYDIDEQISMLKNSDGEKMMAGSTLAAVIIKDKKMTWLSVGDSRIYLFRNDEIKALTRDHNYKLELEEKIKNGKIDQEYYDSEISKGSSLVSFMGAGRLPYIDCNEQACELKSEDRILITSDGLYKTLSDESIKTLLSNFTNIRQAASAIESKANRTAKNTKALRDNTTFVIIRIK